MKITKLRIKNMFGISEYEQDGKNITLKGVKGSGKTSVLDAIKIALRNDSNRDIVLRQGTEEGEIILETDTGISINRRFRKGKIDIKHIKENGKAVQCPEEFLRSLFTELQLNPVEFLKMDDKEQNRIILDLIEYAWNMDSIKEWFGEIVPEIDYEQNILNVLKDIQDEDSYYFRKRQDINRDIRNKTAIVNDIAKDIPDNFNCKKWEKVKLSEIYNAIETKTFNNNAIEKAQTFLASLESKRRGIDGDKEIALSALDKDIRFKRESYTNDITKLKEQIKALEDNLSVLEERKQEKIAVIDSEHKASISELEGNIEEDKKIAAGQVEDVTALKRVAAETEAMKGHINEYKRMVGCNNEISDLAEQSEDYTVKIEKARTLPAEILAECKLPIKGLSIVDGKPLIQGRPINNLSDGEKLELCVSVALEKKTGLNLLLLDGLEKLDSKNREELFKLCKAKDVQFIATITDDSPDLTVVEI